MSMLLLSPGLVNFLKPIRSLQVGTKENDKLTFGTKRSYQLSPIYQSKSLNNDEQKMVSETLKILVLVKGKWKNK